MSIVTIQMIVSNTSKGHESNHGPIITDNSSGEILCGSCGLVLIEKVEDMGNEQRIYDPEHYMSNSRTGAWSTLTIHDRGLSTVIDPKNKDASGNPIFGPMKNTMGRLRLWDSHSKSRSADRSMRSALQMLDTVKTKLDISDAVTERAAYFYRKAVLRKLTRGRNINGLILSALYAACRESNVPRTIQDIANSGNVNTKFLSRHYRLLARELDLNLESFAPSNFVSRLASISGLSEKTSRDALYILRQAKEKRITAGKNPVAFAAAALYLSALMNVEQKSQKKISDSCGISSVTIRNISMLLRKKLGINA
jgi:transcription initiation factor TFIIB